jgi:hypothetical protein
MDAGRRRRRPRKRGVIRRKTNFLLYPYEAVINELLGLGASADPLGP